jgi:hypothetical protein
VEPLGRALLIGDAAHPEDKERPRRWKTRIVWRGCCKMRIAHPLRLRLLLPPPLLFLRRLALRISSLPPPR